MFGIIKKKIDYGRMTYERIRKVKEGNQEPTDGAVATEEDRVKEENGNTGLFVEMDVNEEFVDHYFGKKFPNALKVIKEIAEN